MAGIFGDFIDQDTLDEVEVKSQYGQSEDGVYAAVVSDAYLREGTDNYPDRTWIIIEYSLDNGTEESEWFQLPEDITNQTKNEATKLGFLIRRFGDFGIDRSKVASTEPEELIGKRVAVTLKTTKSKKNGEFYQNVTKVAILPDVEVNTSGTGRATQAAEPEQAARPATRRPNPAARRA